MAAAAAGWWYGHRRRPMTSVAGQVGSRCPIPWLSSGPVHREGAGSTAAAHRYYTPSQHATGSRRHGNWPVFNQTGDWSVRQSDSQSAITCSVRRSNSQAVRLHASWLTRKLVRSLIFCDKEHECYCVSGVLLADCTLRTSGGAYYNRVI